MNRDTLNFGLLGCGRILQRAFIDPARNIEQIKIYGIASRSIENALRYSEQHCIDTVFISYEELLECSAIDAVYITLPPHVHVEWIMKAAKAKKHILVEKPLCLKSKDIKTIESVCKENGVHLLEGLMVQHHIWQQYVKRFIKEKTFGSLLKIHTNICIAPKEGNYRGNYRSDPDQGGGCFNDLGCYWLQFLQATLGLNGIEFDGKSNFDGPNGCDWTFVACGRLENRVETDVVCSFENHYKVNHILEFEGGTLRVIDVFRCMIGNFKMPIELENYTSGEKNKIVLAPENYFANQLDFFKDVIYEKKQNIDINDSYERIYLMEKILEMARSHKKDGDADAMYV